MEKSTPEPSPIEHSPGGLERIPESSTATANSTPTLRGPPRCKDFVEGDEDENGELQRKEEGRKMESIYEDEKLEMSHSRDASTRVRKQSDGSLASVRIADQMTVPPPEDIHPQSRSQ